MPSAGARLLRAHQVPESYREPGILSGYRPPRSSARECLRSLFGMNNETLNVWTHLLPAGYLLWLLVARLREPGASSGPSGPSGTSGPSSGPFLAYLGTCALYPLASSAAHALGAMGGHGRHRAFCCDYAALSLYGLGSALAYSAYAFPLEWVGSTFHEFYVPVAVLNSALSTGLACYSRFLEAERPSLSKAFRTLAFVYPYLFDSIPVFYRLFRSAAGSCSEGSLPLHSRHSLCALLTFLSFTSRLPERLAPGSFDFIGHSHQVFHICGILGTLFQLEAVSVDMAERRGHLPLPSSLETFGSLGMGAAASLAILGVCFRSLRPEPPSREKSH